MVDEIKTGIPNIVVPTIRDQGQFDKFFDSWKHEFVGCNLIIVFDMPLIPNWILNSKYYNHGFSVQKFSWKEIDDDLKEKSWIIPRKSDCVRSYGYYKAWQNEAAFIVTLDDDTMPEGLNPNDYSKESLECYGTHIQTFYNRLYQPRVRTSTRFYNTLKSPLIPRGLPVGNMYDAIGIVHGGWEGTPDYSAKEQIRSLSKTLLTRNDFNQGMVPKNCYMPMCGMNLAWRTELTPLMYFGLQGNMKKNGELIPLPIDRCGDIWCGYYVQHTLNNNMYNGLNMRVYTGEPFVYHTRASNAWNNLVKETHADEMGLEFLRLIEEDDSFFRNGSLYDEYWIMLKEAYAIWQSLFETKSNNGVAKNNDP